MDVLLENTQVDRAVQSREWNAVLTLRADFCGHVLSHRPLADALQEGSRMLGPMTSEELGAAVEKPARRLNVSFDAGLAARVVNGVKGEPGSLPLLEFGLSLLWEKQQRGQLTHVAYEEIGGVERALVQYAEKVFEDLSPEEQGRTQRVLLQLVHPGQGTQDTRRTATRHEVGEENWELVGRLATARLVVTGKDDATGHDTVEVAHEALLGRWQRLQEWVEADRDFRSWQERLRGGLAQWESTGRDDGALLRGVSLAVAEQWLSERRAELSPGEQTFIEASIALLRQEQAHVERQRRRRTLLLATAAVLFLALASVALLGWGRAGELGSIAMSRNLAAWSQTQLSDQQDLALLLSVEAYEAADTVSAKGALLDALFFSRQLMTYLQRQNAAVLSIGFSPDGRLLAVGNMDHSVRLWDVATQKPLDPPLIGHTGWVTGVAFSPDGETLATSSADRTVRTWDVPSRRLLGGPWAGHSREILDVTFSPNGRVIASAGTDRTVRLWEAVTGKPSGALLTGHTDEVVTAVFNSDGTLLASASKDKTVRLWDTTTGLPVGLPLTGHTDAVWGVAFSPDDRLLASGSVDGTVRLYDVDGRKHLYSLVAPERSGVWDVAFSPDGKLLATSHSDQRLRVWDLAKRDLALPPMAGYASGVKSVAFSPDSRTLAAGSFDGTTRLWDAQTGQLIGQPMGQLLVADADRLAMAIQDFVLSPDGSRGAAGTADGTVQLWDMGSRSKLGPPLTGHTEQVLSVAFSPDGKTLASASADRTLRLWDVASRAESGPPLTGHTEQVLSVAFSPDGKTLASGGADATIQLWDVKRRKRLAEPLRGHLGPIKSVAFDPSGRLLASGSSDRSVRLWDAVSFQPLGRPLDAGNNLDGHLA